MTAIKYKDIKYSQVGAMYDAINTMEINIDETALIEPFCVIDKDVVIGKGTIIGPGNHIRSGTVIGDNCRIGGHNVFEGNGIYIGNNVRIGTHCNFAWGVVVEDDVKIAGHFTGANDKYINNGELRPYKIRKGARIGLGVVMLPGVEVGQDALVGAHSTVTKNVKYGEWVMGSPAIPYKDQKKEIAERKASALVKLLDNVREYARSVDI